MLSKEELLQPRYKVIADYPSQAFEMGNIIIGTSAYLVKGEGFCNSGYMQEYPNLFKKLEWSEGRGIEDLPEYVRMRRVKGVFKVKRYVAGRYLYARLYGYPANVPVKTLTPATREEYEQYQESKSQLTNR
jgi:hypothetical protein